MPGGYTHTTLLQFTGDLARKLGDPANVFWSDAELCLYVQEALRTFQAAAGFYRFRGVFPTTAGVPFYDLSAELPLLAGYLVTDQDMVKVMEYQLLEPPTPTVWTGTEMFTLEELAEELQDLRNAFLMETGTVLTHSSDPILPPPAGRVVLADSIIDVRRAAWRSTTGVYSHLWREDEHRLNAYRGGWSVNPETPEAYAMVAAPPTRLQLAPVPLDAGDLDLLTVRTGAPLDPTTLGGVPLGIPDNYSWIVKWGALACLLAKDGPCRDPARAAYCEKRWQDGLAMVRGAPSVVQAEINGVPVQPCSLVELDSYAPNWQNNAGPGKPTVIAVAGHNLIAVAEPVPDGVYSVTLDLIPRFPVPLAGADYLEVGREHLETLLDYAAHLAVFKCGAAETQATFAAYEALMRMAALHNARLRARAEDYLAMHEHPAREQKRRPELVEA